MNNRDMKNDHAPGLEQAFSLPVREDAYEITSIEGEVPSYLRGTYYLNGPARFEHGDRRIVARTVAGFHHARVAAIAVLVAVAHDVEQLADSVFVADFRDRLTACSKVTFFGKRDQLVHDGGHFLGFRQGCHDLLVRDQACGHVREHRLAVRACLVQFAMG